MHARTLEALARRISGHNETVAVPYAAEAGQFQGAGFSTVICGPGSIDQAHQPNEYLAMDQINPGKQALTNAIKRYCIDVGP